MKKLIILPVVIFMLLNAGCSQKAQPSEDPQPALISVRPAATGSTSAPSSAQVSATTSAPASATTPEITKFNFTASDFYDAIPEDGIYKASTMLNEFSVIYDYGEYLAESTVGKVASYRRYMCFSDPETNEIFAISIIHDYVNDYKTDYDFGSNVDSALRLCDPTLTSKTLYEFLNTGNVNIGGISEYEARGVSYLYGRTRQGDSNGEYMVISLTGSAIDPKTLPRKIDKAPDFLAEYCHQVVDCNISCDFKKLLDLVVSYIDIQAPDETDSAYIIKDLLTPIISDASKCTVKYDKLEDDYFVYYKGVESVSKSVNFVPYMENGIIKIIIGFRASDWLFFDDYNIFVDTDKRVYGSVSGKQEEVLSNGSIEEYAKDRLEDDEIQQILESQGPVIRFESSYNDKHKDHELTSAEKSALKAIYGIYNVKEKLGSLVQCWENS